VHAAPSSDERSVPGQFAAGSGMEPAVRAVGLGKSYRHPWTGRMVSGVEDLNLEVLRGEVMGCLGPNGAGKTTTLKLLTGLLKPTTGNAWLFGVPITETESRRRLGFLPEQPYFYEYLTGIEYLEFAGQLSGLLAHDAHARARHWLGRVGLAGREQLVLRKYSKGMLQRIGLAAALIHDPELLILDEPMSGLDPFGRRDVRDLIDQQRERGTTVLFSSHILPDVETLCDRVAIILAGKLTRVATVGEIVSGSCQRVEIRCARVPLLEVTPELRDLVQRQDQSHDTLFILHDDTRLNETIDWLLRKGARIRAVTPQRVSLEDLFLATASAHGEARLEVRRSA
jgi:ABC-2 type transport system ATP-binding protein